MNKMIGEDFVAWGSAAEVTPGIAITSS